MSRWFFWAFLFRLSLKDPFRASKESARQRTGAAFVSAHHCALFSPSVDGAELSDCWAAFADLLSRYVTEHKLFFAQRWLVVKPLPSWAFTHVCLQWAEWENKWSGVMIVRICLNSRSLEQPALVSERGRVASPKPQSADRLAAVSQLVTNNHSLK